jgi:hypothetical protein
LTRVERLIISYFLQNAVLVVYQLFFHCFLFSQLSSSAQIVNMKIINQVSRYPQLKRGYYDFEGGNLEINRGDESTSSAKAEIQIQSWSLSIR